MRTAVELKWVALEHWQRGPRGTEARLTRKIEAGFVQF